MRRSYCTHESANRREPSLASFESRAMKREEAVEVERGARGDPVGRVLTAAKVFAECSQPSVDSKAVYEVYGGGQDAVEAKMSFSLSLLFCVLQLLLEDGQTTRRFAAQQSPSPRIDRSPSPRLLDQFSPHLDALRMFREDVRRSTGIAPAERRNERTLL